MSRSTRTVARILWCTSLLFCPIIVMIVGQVYSIPPGTGTFGRSSWPETVVNAVTIAHLSQAVVALVGSYWAWGKRWWIGCIVVIASLFAMVGIHFGAMMDITGVCL